MHWQTLSIIGDLHCHCANLDNRLHNFNIFSLDRLLGCFFHGVVESFCAGAVQFDELINGSRGYHWGREGDLCIPLQRVKLMWNLQFKPCTCTSVCCSNILGSLFFAKLNLVWSLHTHRRSWRRSWWVMRGMMNKWFFWKVCVFHVWLLPTWRAQHCNMLFGCRYCGRLPTPLHCSSRPLLELWSAQNLPTRRMMKVYESTQTTVA